MIVLSLKKGIGSLKKILKRFLEKNLKKVKKRFDKEKQKVPNWGLSHL